MQIKPNWCINERLAAVFPPLRPCSVWEKTAGRLMSQYPQPYSSSLAITTSPQHSYVDNYRPSSFTVTSQACTVWIAHLMLRLFFNGPTLLIVHYLFMAPTHTFAGYMQQNRNPLMRCTKHTPRPNVWSVRENDQNLSGSISRYVNAQSGWCAVWLCGASPLEIFEASSVIKNWRVIKSTNHHVYTQISLEDDGIYLPQLQWQTRSSPRRCGKM